MGKAEEVIDTNNVLEIKEVTKSERLKQLGWTGSLVNYIKGVVAAGIPVSAAAMCGRRTTPPLPRPMAATCAKTRWATSPTMSPTGHWHPNESADAIIPPAPGEGGAPKPTAVPLTAEQEKGKKLVVSLGCNACHAIKGVMNGGVGPNLSQIASVAEERIASESYAKNLKDQPAAKTAEEYIIQSIHAPQRLRGGEVSGRRLCCRCDAADLQAKHQGR